MLVAFVVGAQSRDLNLQLKVSASTGVSLNGLAFQLTQSDYAMVYPPQETVLDANGQCSIKVFAGNHLLRIEKAGYATVEKQFDMTEDMSLDLVLQEDIRQPFALSADVNHDVFSGKNDIVFMWNRNEPVFFDDFEEYDAFAINFGQWTGIDGDRAAAAPLTGAYPNRGTLQYAQIINPLAVEPVWWYEYPVLRPFSGQQYVGFVRTSSGDANDDWLVSPAIEVGERNIVSFMAKAADVYKEKFQVCVTTVDNPTPDDFEYLSAGNSEQVTYEEWSKMSYDLSGFAGQKVKIAIHYIGDAKRGGAFMLMVDDFFVGVPEEEAAVKALFKARRVMANAAAAGGKYEVFLNGVSKGKTDETTWLFKGLDAGNYTLGVKAVYQTGTSEMSELPVAIKAEDYVKLTLDVSTNNGIFPEGLSVELLDKATGVEYDVPVAGGKAVVSSLKKGTYIVNCSHEMFEEVNFELQMDADKTEKVSLVERIITPYNITVDQTENGSLVNLSVKWNQNLGFRDSFEAYEDFAVGAFGGWISIDNDKMPTYGISYDGGQTLVSFPGSGTASAPTAIAPIVFNPFKTEPAMAPGDGRMVPPTGDKMAVFFSPQRAQADKWLISPAQVVRDNYVWRFSARTYASMYAEEFELCISTTDASPESFTVVDKIRLAEDNWQIFEVDLSQYVGQTIYFAFHYVSTDTYFALLDDFYVGPASNSQDAYVGNVLKYEISLDGALKGESKTPSFVIEGVEKGQHTIGVKAFYASGESEEATYVIDAQGAVGEVKTDAVSVVGGVGEIRIIGGASEVAVYTLAGQLVASGKVDGDKTIFVAPGLYLVHVDGAAQKVAVR